MVRATSVVLLLALSLLHTGRSALKTPFSVVESAWNALLVGTRYHNSVVPDVERLLPEYDFIVVGGGTAGCVVANRLTENRKHKVLLIEAGREESYVMDVPLLANFFQLTETNWGHRTVPQQTSCQGMTNKQCKFPRGKVLGGSSVINYMIYTRGNKRDYDRWRDMGNPGWGYDDVVPYFKKLEDVQIPEFRDSPIRGRGGPVTITNPPFHTPLAESFLESAKDFGYKVHDFNGESQTGFHFIQATMRNGTRLSSNRAYIMPIRNRKNLHVKKYTMVTKILIDPDTKQTYGVEILLDGRRYKIRAKREVILSAGALNTPQVLMLSGVGPADHLKALGLPVIQDLKVGYNLQDHLALGGLTFLVDQQVSLLNERIIDDASCLVDFMAFHRGPVTVPGGVEAMAFVNTKLNNETADYPDMELLFIGGSLVSDPTLHNCLGITREIYDAVYKPMENRDAFTIFPMILRPKSTGRITLRSRNPLKLPVIQHNYLTDDSDLETILQGTKIAIEITKSNAFKKFGTRIHNIPLPNCKHLKFGSDDYWRCAIRTLTLTIYHQCGTAKMGPASDPDAVVDPELRVHGIKGLRVIDASIMPFVPTAHTNGPVFMIAEKGSDLIKATWMDKP